MKKSRVACAFAAVCLAVMMLALVACGESGKLADSKYVGTWNATTAEYAGISMNVSTIMEEFTIELKGDGTATAKVDGKEGSGNWDETDTGIKLIGGVGDTGDLEFTADGEVLAVEYSGAKINFEKQ